MAIVFAVPLTSYAADRVPKRMYVVPQINEIARVDSKGRGRPEAKIQRQSLYAYKTEAHEVEGEAYVVVTDHVDETYLDSLKRLVSFRKGTLLVIDDFSGLCQSSSKRETVLAKLKAAHPRFIAIAPRRESFHENVVLSFLEVIASLDDDPELDAFPAWLVAPDAQSFARLIDQSISFEPTQVNEIKPFTLCQVSVKEFRSQQKACIMDNYFDKIDVSMPSLSVRSRSPWIEREVRSAVGDEDDFVIGALGGGRLLSSVPNLSKEALERASLLMIYGHGAPGKICGLSLNAFEEIDFSGKIVFCGACFSAMPAASDFPKLQRGPDGEEIFDRGERFADRIVSQGGICVLAHMRLSDGFPSVFPIFELMMQGVSAGESVQRLLNAAILRTGVKSGQFCLAKKDLENKQTLQKRNALLWVMIGDPALRMVLPTD